MVETTDPTYAAVGALSRYNIRIVDVKLYIMMGKLLIPDAPTNLVRVLHGRTKKLRP